MAKLGLLLASAYHGKGEITIESYRGKIKKESVIKAIELSDEFFDYIIDIIPNMNKQKEIYKNNIYIQKLVDTLIKEVTDFHIRIILADNFTDYEKKNVKSNYLIQSIEYYIDPILYILTSRNRILLVIFVTFSLQSINISYI